MNLAERRPLEVGERSAPCLALSNKLHRLGDGSSMLPCYEIDRSEEAMLLPDGIDREVEALLRHDRDDLVEEAWTPCDGIYRGEEA